MSITGVSGRSHGCEESSATNCTVSLGLIERKGLRYKLLAVDGSRRKEKRDGAMFSGPPGRVARRRPGPPRLAPRRAAAAGRLLATLRHGLANTRATDQRPPLRPGAAVGPGQQGRGIDRLPA